MNRFLKIFFMIVLAILVLSFTYNLSSLIKKMNTYIEIGLDKEEYKLGDEVYFQAVLFSKIDKKPILEKEVVKVSIYDGNDNRVYFEKIKSRENGTLSGKFSLDTEANSGTYKLVLKNGPKEFTKELIVNQNITSGINSMHINILGIDHWSREPDREAILKYGTILTILFGFIILVLVVIFILKKNEITAITIFIAMPMLIYDIQVIIIRSNLLHLPLGILYREVIPVTIVSLICLISSFIILYVLKTRKYKTTILKHLNILVILPAIWLLLFCIVICLAYSTSIFIKILIMLLLLVGICILIFVLCNNGFDKIGMKVGKLLGQSIIGAGYWALTYFLSEKFGKVSLMCTYILYVLLSTYVFNRKIDKKTSEDEKILIIPDTIVCVFALIVVISIQQLIRL